MELQRREKSEALLHKTSYSAPAETAISRLGVVPLIAGGRKGLAVRFSFSNKYNWK